MGSMEELCLSAKRMGMDSFALTDTNGLYGLIFFLEAARDAGIKPIAGSEVVSEVGRRAVLLVRNRTGYSNLCRILSDRNCHRDFDLIKSVMEKREGLIIISDDFSLLKSLKRDSTEDLFVEMSPGYNMHRCLAFSRSSGIPPIATNRVYMTAKDQFRLHRILRAVDLNTKLSRLGTGDTCREHSFLNSARSMIDQFPHAPDAIENTIRVADRCMKEWDIFGLTFPDFEGMSNKDAFERLYSKTMEGCRRRYGEITKPVKDRVEYEMNIIRAKNFSHYFLVTADLAEKASRSCGRGSAAASIVSYALGITDVDPIRHNLFFERFLNPGRMDPPDIDIDFAWDEREQILDYIFARHGNLKAAMVANHNTYGARSAIREVAKVYGLPEQEIGRVTDRMGFNWRLKDIRDDLKTNPRMRGIEFAEPWDEIIEAATGLEAHFNHLSVHCGGIVIVPDEIRRYCPVEVSANGAQVLQWEKDSVEESGLVKIDILGNRSLAVIRDSLELVKKNHGLTIDCPGWSPISDRDTVEIFYMGGTFGVFYFESPATRQVLTKVASGFTFDEYLKLDHFLLNVVVTSIIRPASNRSIKTWVSRLHGDPWRHIHPLLAPVLEETLGVMVFQEQLSQAAIHMAGFDAAEADILRKVVTKKNREKKLRDFHERFVRGAIERGADPKVIEDVWQMMMGFDGYSFCKPHSASYTMVAYKSAYLRAHYPAEFMASVISNGGGYYSTLGYISEARRMGLSILPPDINLSRIKYTGMDSAVRVGLMQIKEVSRDALDAVIHERERNGLFGSIDDFLARAGRNIHLQDARQLIKAGCFDKIDNGLKRPGLVWKALQFFDKKEKAGSPTLFDYAGKYTPATGGVPREDHYSKQVMLKNETETMGFLLSVHPLELYRDILSQMNHVRAKDLPKYVGRKVTIIGWLVTGKTVLTKDGDPMKFISFEDTTGIYETVFFPEVYHRYCHMLNASRPYIIKGRVEEDSGSINITVEWVGFLDRHKGQDLYCK
jgi:error-prone DNA polymerase